MSVSVQKMISVEQAISLITSHAGARRLGSEAIPLGDAYGRRLAEAISAKVDQPPADVSAMDGYAVYFEDMTLGAVLRVVGESRAGAPFGGGMARGEAVRVFTGAHIPAGVNHVLLQEDASREQDRVVVTAEQRQPENIRRRGLDFASGQVLAPAGQVMHEGAISLAAAGNTGCVHVSKAPRVGVLANGDELVAPGTELKNGQIVNSIQPALLALVRRWGAIPIDLGVSRDNEEDVRKRIGQPCDVIVCIGGASVGDYDVVRRAFSAEGFAPVFEKVAMKPGKPTWFSVKGDVLVLGLPGNPAAAMVTAQLLLRPLMEALTSAPEGRAPHIRASTSVALPASGNREEYLRAIFSVDTTGRAHVRPAENQDSSLLSPFLTANALIRRPAGSPAAGSDELVDVVMLS